VINELIFRGTPQEIGVQHGKCLASDIKAVLNHYLSLWTFPQEQIPQRVLGFKKAIEREFPHLGEEIRGIAEGSGLSENLIYAINARTELLGDASLIECTAVGVSKSSKGGSHVVLGQNWDWVNYFRSLTRVVDIQPYDKPRMKILIEPGMVGKIGMNEAGVGVCLNFLETPQIKNDGIPVHVMLRGILETRDYNSALNLVSTLPRAASANYLIAGYDEEYVDHEMGSLETTPDTINVLKDPSFITHTNSFNAQGEVCARQETFKQALQGYMKNNPEYKLSPEDLKQSFRIPGVEFSNVSRLGGIETIHTIIMNLSKGRFLVSKGAQSENFSLYQFG